MTQQDWWLIVFLLKNLKHVMSKKRKQNFFWISYSDLMTSLFFIMLLLFVLASGGMYLDKEATERQLRHIAEIQEAVKQLPTEYFEEDVENHRWTLKKEFSPAFQDGKDDIYALNDTTKLLEVGHSLIEVVKKLNQMKDNSKYEDIDVSFLVVIEGMASRDYYTDNDALSYRRALSLYYLWKKNGFSFEQSQCEVQVSGSGIRGIRPYNTQYYQAVKKGDPDAIKKYNFTEEKKNQCIIIQIIPKISSF